MPVGTHWHGNLEKHGSNINLGNKSIVQGLRLHQYFGTLEETWALKWPHVSSRFTNLILF